MLERKNDLIAVAGLMCLTLLAAMGRVDAMAVVAFVGGLAIKPEAMSR